MQFSKLYDVAQTRALDKALTVGLLTQTNLIEIASKSVLAELKKKWPHCHDIGILCGPGGNGADGFCLADFAISEGLNVTVYLLQDEGSISEIGRKYLEVIKKRDVKITLSQEFSCAHDVLVDAVFGLGINRQIRGHTKGIFEKINSSNIPVIAIDVPSGLSATTGSTLGAVIKASVTVTFFWDKQGFHTGDGKDSAGEVVIAPLGISETLLDDFNPTALGLSSGNNEIINVKRKQSSHKGDYGHVLVVAGNKGFAGSGFLAASGALRSGSGLVSLATHYSHAASLACLRPELMVHPMHLFSNFDSLIKKSNVLVLGPGLSTKIWGLSMFRKTMMFNGAKVFDADALNLISKAGSIDNYRIITPHVREASRLLQVSDFDIEVDRFAAAKSLVEKFGGVAVLKGSGTIVQTNGELPVVILAGNPGMASGGVGDVLAGIIGGLLAQNFGLFLSAYLGALLHATAGDLAAKKIGERPMAASDIIDQLARPLI